MRHTSGSFMFIFLLEASAGMSGFYVRFVLDSGSFIRK